MSRAGVACCARPVPAGSDPLIDDTPAAAAHETAFRDDGRVNLASWLTQGIRLDGEPCGSQGRWGGWSPSPVDGWRGERLHRTAGNLPG